MLAGKLLFIRLKAGSPLTCHWIHLTGMNTVDRLTKRPDIEK
jgi:hypothetical protein